MLPAIVRPLAGEPRIFVTRGCSSLSLWKGQSPQPSPCTPERSRVARQMIGSSGRGRGVLSGVPVSSNLRHVLPFQALLPKAVTGLTIDSKALAEQIRSIRRNASFVRSAR